MCFSGNLQIVLKLYHTYSQVTFRKFFINILVILRSPLDTSTVLQVLKGIVSPVFKRSKFLGFLKASLESEMQILFNNVILDKFAFNANNKIFTVIKDINKNYFSKRENCFLFWKKIFSILDLVNFALHKGSLSWWNWSEQKTFDFILCPLFFWITV